MIDSYFFVPGDKPNYLKKINSINADYFIVDLEDAVSVNNKSMAFHLVMTLKFNNNMFLRIPFFDNCYSDKQIKALINKFERQIVLPKISALDDVEHIVSMVKGSVLKMIVLVENPASFLAVSVILNFFSSHIHAIGFGSHDFCSITNIKHSLEHLAHYKRQLILFAKAHDVAYLDGVDLNLKNFDEFKKECIFAFESGADGKFIIHPRQLDELGQIDFIKKEELDQLKLVYDKIKGIPINDIDVVTINGIVYEKPHIFRIKKLMEKVGRTHSKN